MKIPAPVRSARSLTFAILLAICTAFLTSSCDEEDGWDSIIGTWELVSPPSEPYNTLTFYGDGSGQYYGPDSWGTAYDYFPFTWDAYGDTLYIYFPSGDTWMYYYELGGGSLYLYDNWDSTPIVYNYY